MWKEGLHTGDAGDFCAFNREGVQRTDIEPGGVEHQRNLVLKKEWCTEDGLVPIDIHDVKGTLLVYSMKLKLNCRLVLDGSSRARRGELTGQC